MLWGSWKSAALPATFFSSAKCSYQAFVPAWLSGNWSHTMQLGTHCCMLQVYLAVYKSFMEAIDAIDNGEAVQEAGREGGRE